VQLERKNKKLEFLGSDIAGIEKAYNHPPSSFHVAKFADYSSITTDRAVYFRQNGDDKWTQWDYPMFGGEVHRLRRALKPFNPLERKISASDMKLPQYFYTFERCDPKNELLIFRDKDFRAVFRSGNGGFKFDEEKSIKASGRRPAPFPKGIVAEVLWMQLPHNWQKKASINGQNVNVMKLKKLKGSRILQREKVTLGQSSKILWQNRESRIKVLPLYGDHDKRFVQIMTHMSWGKNNSGKYLFVPLGGWQSSTRFSENGVSPFPFVRLTQRK